jgi:Spy/CpxP family protein refolding chaperone
MKRNIIVFFLLAAIIAGSTGVWAGSGDRADQPVKDKACRCSEPEERRPPPPSPEGQIDHMTRQLGLTGEQQTKIKALFAKDREKSDPLLQKQAEYRQQFQAAMKSATFNEAAIRAIAVRQAQTEVELTVSRARLRNQVNSLLTPEQRSLAETLPPPFQRGHGPCPMYGDERGPGHRPPPPCGEQRHHHEDGSDEREL